MEMIKRCFYSLFIFLTLCIFGPFEQKIITNSKQVYEPNNTEIKEEVTDRDLAILASLVYEPAPNDENYLGNQNNSECTYEKNNVTGGYIQTSDECYFKNITTNATLKGIKALSGNVYKYIEGMSKRKINLLSFILTAKEENGPIYYFLNGVADDEYKDWQIVSSYTKNHVIGINGISGGFEGSFDSITFKKGNNYVISIRGTDFPDALEWLIDIAYATGKNSQADVAYNYAQSEYNRIIKQNPNAKIYVTGHSLGAYLAQIAGAAIHDIDETNNLTKVVYFNGMGIDFFGNSKATIGANKKTLKQLGEILTDLAIADDENQENCSKVSWSNEKCSSGKLVLYRTEHDPVSSLGLHYGEVKQLEASAEAVNNHSNFHIPLVSKETATEVSNILENIANFFKSIFSNLKSSSSELKLEDGTISEEIFSSVSDISSAISSDELNQITTSKDDYPNIVLDEVNPNDVGFGLESLGNLISEGLYYSKTLSLNSNVLEGINIAHETDSLTCINDSNTKPLEMRLNGFGGNVVTQEHINDRDVFYTNDDLTIHITTQNRCTYNYSVINKNGADIYNGKSSFIKFKNPNAISGGGTRKEDYTIKTSYGNKITNLKLKVSEDKVLKGINNWKYVEGGSEENYETLDKQITIYFDNRKPNCKILTNNLSITGGNTATIKVSCDEKIRTDNLNSKITSTTLFASSRISLGNLTYDKNSSNPEQAKFVYKITVYAENAKYIKKVNHSVNIALLDFAGNTSNNLNTKVIWYKK